MFFWHCISTEGLEIMWGWLLVHCRRKGLNLFKITVHAHPGVSRVSKRPNNFWGIQKYTMPGRPSSQNPVKSKTINNASKFILKIAKKFNFQIKKIFFAEKKITNNWLMILFLNFLCFSIMVFDYTQWWVDVTWQWVGFYSSQFFWSFGPVTPCSVSIVHRGRMSIFNHFQKFQNWSLY